MPSQTKYFTATIPSRSDNPFATCWTKPGALAFLFPAGKSARGLVEQLAAQNWRGEILGPHGSGKSTLLESLKPAIVAAGREIQAVALHSGKRRHPRRWKLKAPAGCNVQTILIIDGYEQLGWLERTLLSVRCYRKRMGLLVTSHKPTGLPTLIYLAPERPLIEQLVAELCAEVSTGITSVDVAASHARHGNNVRDTLFDLYDRHERWRRNARTHRLANP